MIEMLVTSSVIILVIFLIRRISGGKISMRLRYALWLAAVVRLLLPVSLGNSAASVMNLFPSGWRGYWLASVGAESGVSAENNDNAGSGDGAEDSVDAGNGMSPGNPDHGISTISAEDTAGRTGVMTETVKRINAADKEAQGNGTQEKMDKTGADADAGRVFGLIFAVWLSGFLVVGGYLAVSQLRFRKILRGRSCAVSEELIPQMIADRLAGRRMKVYGVDGLASPCLVDRDIYVRTELTRERQKFTHVLAHEYCHARQHDTLWVFFRCVLVSIYWFHPLVWAAAFAAKQDSELACDEAVIRLLGEEERFAYGRTLLYLLSAGHGEINCAGSVLTMEGGKRGVKERVGMIAQSSDRKSWVTAIVVMMMFLVCGCTFTGSEQPSDAAQEAEEKMEERSKGADDNRRVTEEVSDAEFERIRKEFEEAANVIYAGEQAFETVRQEEFYAVLNYRGAMAGRDDSELSLNRKVDYQGFYEFSMGERENPLEDGWYLICRSEEAQISLYGLYTQEFGFRGIKTLIEGDVNTYDMPWCPSAMNESADNIRVLEEAADGLPRRFVFQILSENTSDREIWNLYSGYRYDTGTVLTEELTADIYCDWAEKNLSFTVDEASHTVLITYDGDMELESLDISAYQNLNVEEVRISPDVVGFELDSDFYEGKASGEEGGYEGIIMHLAVGLKLEGQEGLWTNEMPPLAVQVLCRQDKEPAFALQKPKPDTRFILRSPSQSRKLEEILEEKAQTGKE